MIRLPVPLYVVPCWVTWFCSPLISNAPPLFTGNKNMHGFLGSDATSSYTRGPEATCWSGRLLVACETTCCSALFTYCTAPNPTELCFDGESTPTFSGGRLLPAGGDKVFKSDCASARFGPAAFCGLPPPPPLPPAGAPNPIGISDPSARLTAMPRFGAVGCGSTSACTITA